MFLKRNHHSTNKSVRTFIHSSSILLSRKKLIGINCLSSRTAGDVVSDCVQFSCLWTLQDPNPTNICANWIGWWPARTCGGQGAAQAPGPFEGVPLLRSPMIMQNWKLLRRAPPPLNKDTCPSNSLCTAPMPRTQQHAWCAQTCISLEALKAHKWKQHLCWWLE